MLDFDELRSFLAFAERLNFTHAARDLHISQPALHVKIRKLSEALRTPLYIKRGRALSLTAEGRRVSGFARDIVERCGDFERDLAGGGPAGPVVLAAGEGAYLYLLGPALRRFAKGAGITLRLLTLDGGQAAEAVVEGRAHVGVASLDSLPDGLIARDLACVHQHLAIPASHRLAGKKSISIRDLEGCPLVVPPPGRPQRALLSRLLDEARISWTPAVEATGWPLTLEFVRIGIGLAVVNSFCPPPPGVVTRPVAGLPSVRYRILQRRRPSSGGPVERLVTELLRGVPEACRP